MALDRTSTTVRLKSDDGLYYDVDLVDEGGGVVVPDADEDSRQSGTSDAYVALTGSDGNIYRWSLETLSVDNVQHLIQLSPDQSESALAGLDLLFGSEWLRVKVELQETGVGLTPNLIIVDGEPWPVVTVVKCGGSALYVATSQRTAQYSTTSRTSTFVRPNRKIANYVCQ